MSPEATTFRLSRLTPLAARGRLGARARACGRLRGRLGRRRSRRGRAGRAAARRPRRGARGRGGQALGGGARRGGPAGPGRCRRRRPQRSRWWTEVRAALVDAAVALAAAVHRARARRRTGLGACAALDRALAAGRTSGCTPCGCRPPTTQPWWQRRRAAGRRRAGGRPAAGSAATRSASTPPASSTPRSPPRWTVPAARCWGRTHDGARRRPPAPAAPRVPVPRVRAGRDPRRADGSAGRVPRPPRSRWARSRAVVGLSVDVIGLPGAVGDLLEVGGSGPAG